MSSQNIELDTKLREDQEAFNKELIPLLEKYHLVLASQAFIANNGTIASRVVVVRDPEAAATPSPLNGKILSE